MTNSNVDIEIHCDNRICRKSIGNDLRVSLMIHSNTENYSDNRICRKVVLDKSFANDSLKLKH